MWFLLLFDISVLASADASPPSCVAGRSKHSSCPLRRLPETVGTNCITHGSPRSKISPNINTRAVFSRTWCIWNARRFRGNANVQNKTKFTNTLGNLDPSAWYRRKDRPGCGRAGSLASCFKNSQRSVLLLLAVV